MNRRYIDFVPRKESETKRSAVRSSAQVVMPAEPKGRSDVAKIKAKKVPSRVTAADVIGKGLIDTATKRSSSGFLSKRVKKTTVNKTADDKEKEIKRAAAKAEALNTEKMRVPQARFVNTEKVAKRPLSKNVYQKKIVEPKEEPQGLVTIIHKPEKDSKVGLIVTIIITIILGAAAGTVAFLLLPK